MLKFAIFDNIRVVSGSYNWTENAGHRNAENCDFFNTPSNEHKSRFQELWEKYSEKQ